MTSTGVKNILVSTVLVVDDSDLMRSYLATLLAAPGRQILTAATMAEGVEAAVRRKPGAVLLDFVLDGGHTGLEALSAILSLHPTKAAILTHGRLSHADESRARALGAEVFSKPEAGGEAAFLAVVDAWLSK